MALLAYTPYGGHAVTEADGDRAGALALAIQFQDAFAHDDGDGFHGPTLPESPPNSKLYQ